MRVDGYAVGEVGAGEFGGVRGREDGGAAPGGVDVQPEVVARADVGDGREGVVGAEDGGAGRGVHVEGGVAGIFGGGNGGVEGGGHHAAGGVDGDGPHGRGTEAQHLRGFFDAVVPVGAGEEDEFAPAGGVTFCFRVWEEGVARDDDGGGVGGGAALDGDAARVGAGQAEEVGEGAGGGFLDDGQGGRDLVDVDIGVEDGEDELGGYAYGIGGSVEFVQEALVPGVYGVL